MCKVAWCSEPPKNSRSKLCALHADYKLVSKNALKRPHVMYKVERFFNLATHCELCDFDPVEKYPDRPIKQLAAMLDVDHIDSSIKGTDKGEQPNNYQLICKHCHILKSFDNGDYHAKVYRD